MDEGNEIERTRDFQISHELTKMIRFVETSSRQLNLLTSQIHRLWVVERQDYPWLIDHDRALMRYALFNTLHRFGRFLGNARQCRLLDRQDFTELDDFFKRVELVRSAFEHQEDTIMNRPKGERHKALRGDDRMVADATSDAFEEKDTFFGNLVRMSEIQGNLARMSELAQLTTAKFEARYYPQSARTGA